LTEENETQSGRSGDRLSKGNGFFNPEDQVSLGELLLVPWKRKTVVLGCTAICVVLAILVCIFMQPKYRATATIELNEEKSSGADMLSSIASLAGGGPDELRIKIETETAVIQNDSIALAVMKKMGMLRKENPDRLSKAEGPIASVEELSAERRESLVSNFKGH